MSQYKHTITFYSKFKEGDRVSFMYKNKKVSGVVDTVYSDMVDSTVIPIYALTDCDIVFPWGDRYYDDLCENQIIDD